MEAAWFWSTIRLAELGTVPVPVDKELWGYTAQ
jgi:hypothetical protein